ncbi:LysM domain-containing protein [Cnuella takakiae]|uniref:LysM domain-containing protein n=1 Tax=Cnuella takakiae TaxID=1302690 RepID=A0A1M5B2A9_9BACT|nr:LysM peptidoglycan-binding domain-containing protein [Cnuella takakiae]SHF36536.1 LysM domain-containing protein [Cnuella takakiae]
MKKTLLALGMWLFALAASAQEVLVQSNDKGMYVPHTVSPKENFYSIGRLYAISPKDIAAFNGVDMASGLSVGQVINVPLTSANFSQTNENGTPVYYLVGEKEGLYRVSVKNNKVQMASLRKWNKLASDNIATGQKLIVGYIQSTGLPATPASTVAAQQPAAKPQEAPRQTVASNPEPVKPAQQTREVARQDPPAEVKVRENAGNKPAPVAPRPQEAAQPARQLSTPGSGYFKGQFEAQSRTQNAGKDLTLSAGIFKTSSGWQDGKFYALMDGVEPGTIVRIVNPGNNKVVFAKVLGEMSGIRQNTGLDIRISNAAAAALEEGDGEKFVVRVNY